MSLDESIDRELDKLEQQDIKIRTEMSIVQHHVVLNNITSSHRDLRETCDLRRIMAVSKTLH